MWFGLGAACWPLFACLQCPKGAGMRPPQPPFFVTRTQWGWEPHSSSGALVGMLTPHCCGMANLMPHHLMLEVLEKGIFLLFTNGIVGAYGHV